MEPTVKNTAGEPKAAPPARQCRCGEGANHHTEAQHGEPGWPKRPCRARVMSRDGYRHETCPCMNFVELTAEDERAERALALERIAACSWCAHPARLHPRTSPYDNQMSCRACSCIGYRADLPFLRGE